MKRREFLTGAAAGGAISMLDWLGYFRRYGVPGTGKSLGLAEAVAQAAEPRFLVMWFQEGGWDSYSMFSPLDTPNHATLTIPAGTLNPSPSWSSQYYRPTGYGLDALHGLQKTYKNLTYGYLAQDGSELFDDLAVISTHTGNTFHSGGRWEYHYGKYASYAPLTAARGPKERTVLQAFSEVYGAKYPLSHVSWHRWLADGELDEANYPEGTGYYEKLGPAYAHTNYGTTPSDMRDRLAQLGNVTSGARTARIRAFVDDLNQNFLKDKHGETVTAFSSAMDIYKQLTSNGGLVVDPTTLFTDPALRAAFNVAIADEVTTSTSVNGNPARSKNCPNTNVQAMMAYELMTKGLSNAFWIENRQIRGFDTHRNRKDIFANDGQSDQLASMKQDLWTPLKAFVKKLKSTPYGTGGKTYWDLTTIVLASEMGRTIQGDVGAILATTDPDATKSKNVLEQDCCQHWRVGSVAFLGGTVQGNRQWGRVGTSSLEGIPIRVSDGTLDPAYDPATGVLKGTKDAKSVITNGGHVYSTALYLSGIDPAGRGLNDQPPLTFVKKSGV
jgi:hypothetical protein